MAWWAERSKGFSWIASCWKNVPPALPRDIGRCQLWGVLESHESRLLDLCTSYKGCSKCHPMLALATSSQGYRLSSWPGSRTVCEKRASRFFRLALEVQGGSWMRWCTDEFSMPGRQKQEIRSSRASSDTLQVPGQSRLHETLSQNK